MRDYRNLRAWQRSHQWVLDIYRLTESFPRAERFGLAAQLRRSAASVPSNIAEGSSRTSRLEYARFLDIAIGSVSEAEYQLLLARDLGYLDGSGLTANEANEIRRMLSALRRLVLAGDGTT